MSTSTPKKRLSWKGRLALIGVGLLLAVITIEIAGRILRLMPVTPPDNYWALRAVVGKLPEPYDHFFYRQEARPLDESEFVTWVHFNYRSLRDIDHPLEPPQGAQRILFLGDSFVAAWEVDQSAAFVTRLRQSLNALPDRPQGYDLVSAGFHGWGTDRETLWYREEGRRYDPDLVVLQIYVANDVLDNGIGVFDLPRGEQRPYFMLDEAGQITLVDYPDPKPQPYTAAEQGLGGQVRWWLNQYSFTYRLLRDGLKTLGDVVSGQYGAPLVEQPPDTPPDETDATTTPQIELFREAFGPTYDQRWQDSWTITRQLIRALRDEIEAGSGTLAVILVPPREEENPVLWQQVIDWYDLGPDWDPGQPSRLFREFLEAEGIPYLDMLPPSVDFMDRSGLPMRFEIDPHWTVNGHCAAAVVIQNWLLDSGLVAGPGDYTALDPVAVCRGDNQ